MGQTQGRDLGGDLGGGLGGGLELVSIQDLYKWFMEECPSGTLYLHEFKRMFGVRHGSPEVQYTESLFRAFDMNHDNTLDFIEYVAALHLVLRGKLEDKLRWSFKVFDSDNNGHLDKDEIQKIIKIIYKIKKDSLTEEKDLENMTPDQICDRIFQEVDLNNDGEISLEEFLQGAQRRPWLQNFLRLDVNPSAWVQRHMSDRTLNSP